MASLTSASRAVKQHLEAVAHHLEEAALAVSGDVECDLEDWPDASCDLWRFEPTEADAAWAAEVFNDEDECTSVDDFSEPNETACRPRFRSANRPELEWPSDATESFEEWLSGLDMSPDELRDRDVPGDTWGGHAG